MRKYFILLIVIASIPLAQSQKIEFLSEGVTLTGYMYKAPNSDKKPTLIWLQGNPGAKENGNSEFAKEMNNLGINVFRFNYRGTWETEGLFNLNNSLKDLTNALDVITNAENIGTYNIDKENIIVGGNSWGTNVALVGAVYDKRIKNVICLAVCDHSYFGREYMDPDSNIREFLELVLDNMFLPNGFIKQEKHVLMNDLTDNLYKYDFVKHARNLLDTRLLIFAALDDDICKIENHFFPLYNELKKLKHKDYEVYVEKCPHGFDCDFGNQVPKIISEWIHN